ncbi:MAG TPA: phosphoribosylglycinamide formyltransferase [Polyangiaceae bacterium]|jgi:phosphoribosylglycinamide formyltransferase-1
MTSPLASTRSVPPPRSKQLRLGVLLSGSGTNFQAILDAIDQKRLDAKLSVVVSNVASAGGIDRAKARDIPAIVIDHRRYGNRKDFDSAVLEVLEGHQVDYVVLAGFMRVLTSVLLDAFPMRVVNIHPALLPAFPGLNAQSQAFTYGVKLSGCTVHFVDAGTDTGPIIAQAVVPVRDGDDDESLRARILRAEHHLFPLVLQWIAEGRVTAKPGAKPNDRARVVLEGVEGAFVHDIPMHELIDR